MITNLVLLSMYLEAFDSNTKSFQRSCISSLSAVSIRQRDAVLWGGRLSTGERVRVPDDRHVHVFVARGSASLEHAGELSTGDAARLFSVGDVELVAGVDGAEVLVWATA